MVAHADDIGKKCHEEKLKEVDQCLMKHIDKSRILSDEKIKKEKEEKKKKRKEMLENKKKSKEAWLKSKLENKK